MSIQFDVNATRIDMLVTLEWKIACYVNSASAVIAFHDKCLQNRGANVFEI